jgi:hypothetical protein
MSWQQASSMATEAPPTPFYLYHCPKCSQLYCAIFAFQGPLAVAAVGQRKPPMIDYPTLYIDKSNIHITWQIQTKIAKILVVELEIYVELL